MQPDAEDQNEHDRGNEFRHDAQGLAEQHQPAIAPSADPKRRPHPARDAERHDEGEGQRSELQGIDQRRADERRHGRAERERAAHVAHDEVPDPIPVLDGQRPIDAHLMVEQRHRARIGERSEHGASYIAREELPAQKDDHRQDRERDERQERPARQELENHRAPRGRITKQR